jgi:ubiquinone/menaquinone biosynthesis C-methylase UbiE
MQKPFRKELTHLSWDEVYARQAQRVGLVGEWMDALRLKKGDRVLEIGSGPGYVSLLLADRVGPMGMVYAVDRSPEALAFLERLQQERGVANIERFVADAAALKPTGFRGDKALLSMVLHHAADPTGILQNIADLLSPAGLLVIAEFDPDGPCDRGPPREYRLTSHQIRAWCETAGLLVLTERRQTSEHYMMVVKRRA